MKVLMLGWELPPNHTGGMGMVCYQMCKELARGGADIEFILPYTADHSSIDFMKVTAAHPQDVDSIKHAGGIYDSQRFEVQYKNSSVDYIDLRQQQDMFVSNVCKIVKLAEFDVIHAHDWLTMRAAIAAKQITGKPLIMHIHATEYDRSAGSYGNPVVRDIEYFGMMMADKVVAISHYVKNILVREYSIPESKIEVIHNKVDYDTFVDDGGQANAFHYLAERKKQGYRVVSSIGRLTIQKNLVNLMYAIKGVIDVNPKTIFLLVGSGEQYTELVELAANLRISEQVIFVPFITGKKWRDAFRISDLFVMPSVSEPFGITPLEAIGFGTPALVSNQSGVSEVINNILKVDFWDVDEMINQINAVLSHDSLRDELHRNSLEEWSKLGWKDAADQILDVYKKYKEEARL